MSRETADRIFALLKKSGCYSVHIGGGEPFMNFDKLLDVCISARENGVVIDYIETNASWYTDDNAVADKLKKLIFAGVDCLLISVDPFHNEFVPYIKIKNLLKCCRKNGMETFIWQSKFEKIVQTMDENKTHSLSEYENKFGKNFIKSISQSYGLGFNGRALRILEKITEHKQPYDYYLKENQCGDRIKSLHHFHVDLDGNFIPPSCNGFRANIFDLCGNGLDAEKYIYFTAIADIGISALFRKAQELGFAPKNDGYASKCALCFDIKKYICENIRKNTGTEPVDIGPLGFFEES